jgi:hypothetical protein
MRNNFSLIAFISVPYPFVFIPCYYNSFGAVAYD